MLQRGRINSITAFRRSALLMLLTISFMRSILHPCWGSMTFTDFRRAHVGRRELGRMRTGRACRSGPLLA